MNKPYYPAFLLALLVGASSLVRAEAARAAEFKPIVVFSVSSYDHLTADAGFLAGLADSKEFLDEYMKTIKVFAEGIDKTRPIGGMLRGDGQTFLAFVPVKDLSQVLRTLQGFGWGSQDAGGGVVEIETPATSVFVKESNGWAFFARTPDHLAELPEKPEDLIAGLKSYDIAVQLNMQNVPAVFQQMAVMQMKAGVEAGMRPLPNESEEAFAKRKKFVESSIGNVERMFKETDKLTLGFAVDSEGKKVFLEVAATAMSGSKLAEQFAATRNAKSDFTGFLLPDAAATFQMASRATKEEAAQAAGMVDMIRDFAMREIDKAPDIPDENARTFLKEMAGNVVDVLEATVRSGRFEGAGALMLKPEALSFVAGGYVADGTKLEATFTKAVNLLKNEPDFPNVDNAGTHKGVNLYTMKAPVDDRQAARVLGDELEVVVGMGKESFYVAFGKDSVATLKKAIDDSAASPGKSVVPAELAVALGPILTFASSVDGNPITAAMAKEAEKYKGKDRLLITAKPISDGMAYRYELEEGILKVAGQAAKQAILARALGGL